MTAMWGWAEARDWRSASGTWICSGRSLKKRQMPPTHRFGWYCVQAFDALDSGDAATCVRLLRTGLDTYKGAKLMVEFLLKHTPELQTQPEPSTELLALADQIRTVLANFAPDDPAVAALKQSETYQKVAYLIGEASVPIAGGLLQ